MTSGARPRPGAVALICDEGNTRFGPVTVQPI
jgi:hypothetical protein